jgi:diaminohydroxyphosphoribosylaminopyrimidine deaminase/5-amino-6-(5-phosphoribosylamino)uracil reductase
MIVSETEGIDVTAIIDETTAWHLVRAVSPALAEPNPSVRVHHNPRPSLWLQVEASGDWEASAAVSDEARDLFDLFLPLQLRPDLVIAQAGQSLDGRIATENGHSHYITGPADIRRLHRLRALVDAVVIGAGTVASDNPQLTVRDVEGENPVRVVLDPDNRLEPGRHVFTDGAATTLVVHRAADGESGGAGGVVTLPVTGAAGFQPRDILTALRDRGLRRVLVEGGGITVSRFLEADVVDRLHVTVAPLLIGSGRPAFTLNPIDSLQQAIRPPCRTFRLGDDILFDLNLH